MMLAYTSTVCPLDIGHLSPIAPALLRGFAIVIPYMYVLDCCSYLSLFAALFAMWQPHICSGGVVQGGFQHAELLSLAAHPGHGLEKRTQATSRVWRDTLFPVNRDYSTEILDF